MVKSIEPLSKRVEPVTIEGYNELSNVMYRGENTTYRLYDDLTKPMNLHQLSEFYEIEKKEGNPVPANSELLWSIFTAVNSKDENLIQRIRNKLRNNLINTLTGINWYSNGNARVIHNKGTLDSYFKQGKLIGRDGYISDIKPKKILKNVFGNENIEEINNVSQKINNAPMYLWRINSKPSEKVEYVVRLVAFVDRLNLAVHRFLSSEYPAFLVRQVE